MGVKNKLLKHCSIKNILIVICVLILLYLIYDTYVVRENFEISAFDIFKSSDLGDAAGDDGVADQLDDFCEKIQQLYALCTRCESDDQKFNKDKLCQWDLNKVGFERGADKPYLYLGTRDPGYSLEVSGNKDIPGLFKRYIDCKPGYKLRLPWDKYEFECNDGIIDVSSSVTGWTDGSNVCEPDVGSCDVSGPILDSIIYAPRNPGYWDSYNDDEPFPYRYSQDHSGLKVRCKYPDEYYPPEQRIDGNDLKQLDLDFCGHMNDANKFIDKLGKCRMLTITMPTNASELGKDGDQPFFSAWGKGKIVAAFAEAGLDTSEDQTPEDVTSFVEEVGQIIYKKDANDVYLGAVDGVDANGDILTSAVVNAGIFSNETTKRKFFTSNGKELGSNVIVLDMIETLEKSGKVTFKSISKGQAVQSGPPPFHELMAGEGSIGSRIWCNVGIFTCE